MQCQPLRTPWKKLGIPPCRKSAFLVYDNFRHRSNNRIAQKSKLIQVSYQLRANPSFICLSDKYSWHCKNELLVKYAIYSRQQQFFYTFRLNFASLKTTWIRLRVFNRYMWYKLLKITLRRIWDAMPTVNLMKDMGRWWWKQYSHRRNTAVPS